MLAESETESIASKSNSQNPFMRIGASSFMPTTSSFVPSPAKPTGQKMAVNSASFSPDFSPMQAAAQNNFSAGVTTNHGLPLKSLSMSANEVPRIAEEG